jgi:hypothetical protein
MASDSLQNICALEPGLKRSDNVPPRHHASWLQPGERSDAACIDAIRADAVFSSTDAAALKTEMSFGAGAVDGPCDIEER